MGDITVNLKTSRLPSCPRCGSRLSYTAYRWLTNVLGLTEPHFKCDFCGWKRTKSQIQKHGMTDSKKKHHKHRHKHSHHHRHSRHRRR